MISQHIFTTLRDNITGLSAGGGKYHIYPKKVPDGESFERAVVYNKINSNPVYGQMSASVQLTCIAKTYGDCESLSHEITTLFADKRYSAPGDVLSTSVRDIVDLPQDEESKYYLTAVTIYIKTCKAIG